eukprot:6721272-Prymnesium_polylepis.1
MCATEQHAQQQQSSHGERVRVAVAPLSPLQPQPLLQTEHTTDAKTHIGIIGGGVSGVYAALTLAELGYRNITILEKEMRVGGKAAAFEYQGKKYPLGAVCAPTRKDWIRLAAGHPHRCAVRL